MHTKSSDTDAPSPSRTSVVSLNCISSGLKLSLLHKKEVEATHSRITSDLSIIKIWITARAWSNCFWPCILVLYLYPSEQRRRVLSHWCTHAHDLGLPQYQKSRGRLATPTAGDRRLEPDSPAPLLQLPTHSTACPWGVQGYVLGSLSLHAAAEMDSSCSRGRLQASGCHPRPLNQSS